MATQNPSDMSGDILSQIQYSQNQSQSQGSRIEADTLKSLQSIQKMMEQIMKNGGRVSQANALNAAGGSNSYAYTSRRGAYDTQSEFDVRKIQAGISSRILDSVLRSRGLKGMTDSIINTVKQPIINAVRNSVLEITDGIEHSIRVAMGQADLSKKMKLVLDGVASDLGVEAKDIKKGIGRALADGLLKDTGLKTKVASFGNLIDKSIDDAKSAYEATVRTQRARLKSLQEQYNSINPNDLPEESTAAKSKQSKQSKSSTNPENLNTHSNSENIIGLVNNIVINTNDIQHTVSQISTLLMGYIGKDASTNNENSAGTNKNQGSANPNPSSSEVSESVAAKTRTEQSTPVPILQTNEGENSAAQSVRASNSSTNAYSTQQMSPYAMSEDDLRNQYAIYLKEQRTKGWKEIPRSRSKTTTASEVSVNASSLAFPENGDPKYRMPTSATVQQYVANSQKLRVSETKKEQELRAAEIRKAQKDLSEASLKGIGAAIKSLVNSRSGGLFGQISSMYRAGNTKYREEMFLNTKAAMTGKEYSMSGMASKIASLTGGGGSIESIAKGAALSGIMNVISGLNPKILLVKGSFKLLSHMIDGMLVPAIDGFKKTVAATDAVWNRYHTSQLKNIENSQKRLLADINTLVSTPFEILRKGAEEWYNAWDSNLRTINATQGYTKADLQDLMASFADRLRSEGLTSVVSATDITNNLTKVLQAGLSGEIAEEFAYVATKLNAAIPTQDFFSYADTYASIAANGVRLGMTQTEAIEYANQQLSAFANNILYASREVAGGFTTGLTNAEALFKQSVQIAQAGKSYNASEISGVMASVAAITGAIAPDLANAMTDAIYKAAVGGNSNDIVALRSLAGVGASNTEFLKQLTSNPKEVFANLFSELAERQSMSADAYMEVANELANIFGVSADSFARVDFAYLAQAIQSMDTSSKALLDNMALLASGETTTNAEQMKMQEINKLILDEGLSYVLDNEAARAIQQHMWDEQLARELQETEYGVNLHGAALELLEGIRHAVDTIATILNPFKLLGKLASLFTSSKEDDALKADVAEVLELGKVGNGNARSKYNLTSYRESLKVTDDLNTMFGGTSSFKSTNKLTNELDTGIIGGLVGGISRLYNNEQLRRMSENSVKSEYFPATKYKWGSIGKSQLGSLMTSSETTYELAGIDAIKKAQYGNETVSSSNATNLQKMIDSMEGYVKSNPSNSYEEWASTARKFGIADYDKVLEDSGLSSSQLENQYALLQAQIDASQKKDRDATEEAYWESTEQSLTSVSQNTASSSDNIFNVAEIAKTASATLASIQLTYDSVSASVQSIDTKMDSIISGFSDTKDSNNSILSGLKDYLVIKDENRLDPTGNELSVAGWLQYIYNKMADFFAPAIENINEHVETVDTNVGTIAENSSATGAANNSLELAKTLMSLINMMQNPTQFAAPMEDTLNGILYSNI